MELWFLIAIVYLGGTYLWMTKIMAEYCREIITRLERIVKVNWDEDTEGNYVFQKECTYWSNTFWKYLIDNAEQISPVILLRQFRIISSSMSEKESLYPSNFVRHFKQLTYCEKKVRRWEKELKRIHYFENVPR